MLEVQLLSQKCFNVTIEDDDVVEGLEMVVYQFNGTTPDVDISSTRDEESFTIIDNDCMSL